MKKTALTLSFPAYLVSDDHRSPVKHSFTRSCSNGRALSANLRANAEYAWMGRAPKACATGSHQRHGAGDNLPQPCQGCHHRTITLGAKAQYVSIVCETDYAYLLRWKWTFARSSPKFGYGIYGRRSIRVCGQNVTILLSRVILNRAIGGPPSELHTADHFNNATLDNRRCNLRWATPREQRQNRANLKGTERKQYVSNAFENSADDAPPF